MNAQVATSIERHRPVQDSEQCAEFCRRESSLPCELARPDACLIRAHDLRREQVRALRTRLLLQSPADGSADLLALVSPGPGEGRSLLAAELAMAFAQTGRRTLLVDADLRNPRQHRLFQAAGHEGLTPALTQGVAPVPLGVQGLPNLSVLVAGPVVDDPLALLSSRRFVSLLAQWRADFDVVLVDTAPAARFADALAVASLTGRALALSRAGRTPYRELQTLLQGLATLHTQVLGAVLSHF